MAEDCMLIEKGKKRKAKARRPLVWVQRAFG